MALHFLLFCVETFWFVKFPCQNSTGVHGTQTWLFTFPKKGTPKNSIYRNMYMSSSADPRNRILLLVLLLDHQLSLCQRLNLTMLVILECGYTMTPIRYYKLQQCIILAMRFLCQRLCYINGLYINLQRWALSIKLSINR
jgi:hypothetical protein